MKYKNMEESCKIFQKYDSGGYFEAGEGVVFGPSLDTEFTDLEKEQLKDFGWFESDYYDCWSTYC